MNTAKPISSGSLSAEDDVALVTRFRACGDPDALGQIFSRYADAAFRVAVRQTGNLADAEEAVQCAFTQFLERGGDAMAVRGSVRSYVIGAVLHNCCSLQRREVTLRQRHESAGNELDKAGATHADDGEARRELEVEIKAAIDALPEDLRLPVWMRYFEDLSFAEIATVLATKEITLRKRVERGLALLRRHLSGRGFACSLAALPCLFVGLSAEEYPGTFPITTSAAHSTSAKLATAKIATAKTATSSSSIALVVGAAALLVIASYVILHQQGDPRAPSVPAPAIPEQGLIYKDDFSSRRLHPFWAIVKGQEHIAFPAEGGGMLLAASNRTGREAVEIELISTSIPMAQWDLHWEIAPPAPVGTGAFSCGIDIMNGDGLYMSNRVRVSQERADGPYTVNQRKVADNTVVGDSVRKDVPRLICNGHCIMTRTGDASQAITINDMGVDIQSTKVEVMNIRIFLRVEPGGEAAWRFREIAVARDKHSLALPASVK